MGTYLRVAVLSPRASEVPHKVVYDGGETTVLTDQDCATGTHGEWYPLGTFAFAAGTGGYVEISNEGVPTASYVGADAVRLARGGFDAQIVGWD